MVTKDIIVMWCSSKLTAKLLNGDESLDTFRYRACKKSVVAPR